MLKKILKYFLILIFTNFYTCFLNAKIVEDKIFIGTTFSSKGENSSKSVLYQSHYNRVIEKINSSDGIRVGTKKYLIEIISYDNESNLLRNNSLIKRLIQNDGVQFLIGSNEFELSEEIINLLSKNETVIINSYDAISDYKVLFEKLRTINSKKIREHLLNNQ
jgi:ABC-type branched-subunit amino acid transport system substrate-binding protein